MCTQDKVPIVEMEERLIGRKARQEGKPQKGREQRKAVARLRQTASSRLAVSTRMLIGRNTLLHDGLRAIAQMLLT
jgi:hypothetical protein